MQEVSSDTVDRVTLKEIAEHVREQLEPGRKQELEIWSRRLREGRFHLALLGEFNRGKSTLGNALIGADILPAAVIPTTAIPTFVRYSPAPMVKVRLAGGDRLEVDPNHLDEFVSEEKNPRNVRGVRMVEVFHPSEFLRGVDLLDTPGVGSTHRHNTETALGIMGDVDAAVVVLAADQPVGQNEVELLETLRPRVARFFFAVNRMDLLSSKEREESLSFVARILEARGFTGVELYPISARTALATGREPGFERLRQDLVRFLREEKEAAWCEGMRRRLVVLLSETLFELRLGVESARLLEEERFERREQLRRKLEVLGGRQLARSATARERFRRMLEMEDEEFARFERDSLPTLHRSLGETVIRGVSNRDVESRLRTALLSGGDELLAAYIDSGRPRVRRSLHEIAEEVSRDWSEEERRTYEIAGKLFGIHPPTRGDTAPPPQIAETSFEIQEVRCSLEEATDFLLMHLPRALARKFLLRRARESARELLNRAGGRLRHEILSRGETYVAGALEAIAGEERRLSRRLMEILARAPAERSHRKDDSERAGAVIELALSRLGAA